MKTRFKKTSFKEHNDNSIMRRSLVGAVVNKSKAEKGDIVEYQGNKHKVSEVTFSYHPESIGSKVKSAYFYQLTPVDNDVEEPNGWINEKHIKKTNDFKDECEQCNEPASYMFNNKKYCSECADKAGYLQTH